MSFTGPCPHCREFYANNMGLADKHLKKCKKHLFCAEKCEKGRKAFIDDLAEAIANKLTDSKRPDLGAAILNLLHFRRR